MDPKSPFFGGVLQGHTGRPSAVNYRGTPADLITMCCVYNHPKSDYYQDKTLIPHLEAAARYLIAAQGRDGLISMDYCNFDSPPDTGFVVVGLSELFQLLLDLNKPELTVTKDLVEQFLRRSEPGLVAGGVHTPNHRWVLAGALVWLNRLFGSDAAVRRAKQWLEEGIDISPDGEWTERSNGVYNSICNIMFWHLANFFELDEYREPIRKNLDFILTQVQPNGMLVTDYSTRQDRLNPHYLNGYFLMYRLMANEEHNPQWAYLAEKAFAQFGKHGPLEFSACTHELLYMMRYPKLMARPQLEPKAPSVNFQKHIERKGRGFGVVRVRNGNRSTTLVGGQDSLGSFHFGEARLLSIRPTIGFFGKALIKPEKWLVKPDGSYVSEAKITAPYFGPLAEIDQSSLPPNVDLLDMYNSHRPEVDVCFVKSKFKITPTKSGFDLVWQLEPSVSKWPMLSQLTLSFGKEGALEQYYGLQSLGPDSFLLVDQVATYHNGPWQIEVENLNKTEQAHLLPALQGDVERVNGIHLLLNSTSQRETRIRIKALQAGRK